MGADYPGQERAIEELQSLSPEARKFLGHHIRNSLMSISGARWFVLRLIRELHIYNDEILDRINQIEKEVRHIQEDLEKIDC
jgi:hypothetical protein